MASFDLMEGVRKAFLAGVGAVATGAEKVPEIVDELVRKGELTVEQGKELNSELTRKAKEAVGSASDAGLRAKLKSMTPEERAAWIAKAQQMASDLDATPVDVEVEDAVDDGADEAGE